MSDFVIYIYTQKYSCNIISLNTAIFSCFFLLNNN